MNNLSHHQPHHNHTELHSRATSSSRSKWNELEVSTYVIYVISRKPFWEKLFWLIPILGISPNCPSVYEHTRVFRYVETIDRAFFDGCMGKIKLFVGVLLPEHHSTTHIGITCCNLSAQIDCNPAITRSSIVFYELDKMTNLFSSHRSKSAYLETT
ncbi:hypothetical protein G4B88_008856 [Cannabis sativa]|uniref:Uncharacterized protein n=1 Tax=Cannabis sativa TaxID=3483 RepID=A0A7J6HRT4_CANSA|nr:hypothetical protein G4B88_008856 [Cannabis sativa]